MGRATIKEEGIRMMIWTAFKNRFLEKYFSIIKKYRREREFVDLTQVNKSVEEYTTHSKGYLDLCCIWLILRISESASIIKGYFRLSVD